ncbi:17058_t:CDS:2 [Cetraspora pellucida]|uniref:17058_t:CDS:1 n=1 Tax=Cetraspora pellucida TaxID=1433469 RepID=A0ACA9KEM8_9GLOM|nr:17058_t:CDS:2 [Cetraspora pellucida]
MIVKKKTSKAIKRKTTGIAGLIDDVYAHSVIEDYKKWIEYLKSLNEFDAAVREHDLKQTFDTKKNEYDEKIKRLEEEISSLKNQLSVNHEEISFLKDQLRANHEEISSLQDKLSTKQDKVIEFENKISKLTNDITRQEFYPLLKVMEENLFANLPENLHFAYENLNYNYYTHEATAYNDDPQVDIDNQESINIVSSNNQEIDISNQDTILYQTQKQEIFNLIENLEQDLYYEKNCNYYELENKLFKEQEKSTRLHQKWEEVCLERNKERQSAANLRQRIIALENKNRELRSKLLSLGQ